MIFSLLHFAMYCNASWSWCVNTYWFHGVDALTRADFMELMS